MNACSCVILFVCLVVAGEGSTTPNQAPAAAAPQQEQPTESPEVTALKAKVAELEKALTTSQSECSEAKATNVSLNGQIESLTKASGDLHKAQEASNAQIKTLEDRVSGLTTDLEKASTDAKTRADTDAARIQEVHTTPHHVASWTQTQSYTKHRHNQPVSLSKPVCMPTANSTSICCHHTHLPASLTWNCALLGLNGPLCDA